MSGIVSKNAGRASGIVGAGDIGADAVDSANIADDAIDSEHYADGSIDNAHIADDAIDSEHYAAGSIDTAHIATNQIDETLMKDAFVGDFSDVTVTAADAFLYGDATDSGNTKKDTIQGILDLASGTTPQTVTGSFNVNRADSTHAVTGVGFAPGAMSIIWHLDGQDGFGICHLHDGSSSSAGYYLNYGGVANSTNSGGTQQVANVYNDGAGGSVYSLITVSSWDVDGFTLTTAKTGSPSGTWIFTALCFK